VNIIADCHLMGTWLVYEGELITCLFLLTPLETQRRKWGKDCYFGRSEFTIWNCCYFCYL